jgi:hypothetical protein
MAAEPVLLCRALWGIDVHSPTTVLPRLTSTVRCGSQLITALAEEPYAEM